MTSETARTYTFLVTLILLVAVTFTVIARSIILRRRDRQSLAQATNERFAADVGLSIYGTRRRQRVVGEKPALWQMWTRSPDDVRKERGRVVWTDIKPVSIAYIDKEEDKEQPPQCPPLLRTQKVRGPFHRRPSSSQESPTSLPCFEAPSSGLSDTFQLRISVLVAMPAPEYSASFSHPWKDRPLEVDRLPPIEIGVVEMDVHG